MKSLIIYNTKSGNTEELANKMKTLLEQNGHSTDLYRDKDVRAQIKEQENFFEPYDLLCLGSCTHAMSAARSFKKFLKKIPQEDLVSKKLICFGTSGGPNMWKKACESIKKKVPGMQHIGDIGCVEKENDQAIKEFETLMNTL
ncbi:MAG: hypothetical protein EU539_05935 [Promethearchaeota archaeon]|nr:MAG: hypothetical protein EU539_05935 [Candidatus Lokiarchaeota archaeon]